jgi:hydrogenase nickel incorporation protein HypB
MTCGCGNGEVKIEGQDADASHEHEHVGADGMIYRHVHQHPHTHSHDHGAARGAAQSGAQARTVQIERDILAKNNAFAVANRERFEQQGVLALNLVSSPGSGKTSLLVRTIAALREEMPLAVIEGDQQTSLDAERIRATGAAAVQVNTGKGCHLDAQRVQQALAQLALPPESLLFIENVGNLVCPAAFDLGEACKVVILSVTEGEDKPLKYPDMFQAARLMLLNKCDLLPYLAFDVQQVIENARRVNPAIEVMQVSAVTGDGMEAWLDWLASEHAAMTARRADTIDALKRRVAELEAQLQAQQPFVAG